MRKIIIIILCLVLASNVALAETTVYVTVNELNGRAKATTDSRVEASFYLGDELTVVGYSGKWVKVRGGEMGTVFVYAQYVSEISPEQGATQTDYRVVSNGRVHIRREPNLKGAHVRWVENGDVVGVRLQTNGWCFIGDGWVMDDFLEEIDE